MRLREPGKHWGAIKAKHLEVFEALLWGFHNCKIGLCFPSYEAIADKVPGGYARSTVALALIALEKAGLLTWVHRLKRVYERGSANFLAIDRHLWKRRGDTCTVLGVSLWNLIIHLPGGLPMGSSNSLDMAKAQFKAGWEALKARTTPEQLAAA
jgi:hypothetical protein